jgi:hypothetical protein
MLDPATVQLLFADLQPPIVARSKTNPPQSLSRAASVLAQCRSSRVTAPASVLRPKRAAPDSGQA